MNQPLFVLWDVDTQNDFFDTPFTHEGVTYQPSLPVPDARSIRTNLKQLVQYATTHNNWRLLGSVDAHTKDDVRHLAAWGTHCMQGTPGAQKISETYLPTTRFVPAKKLLPEHLERIVTNEQPIYFEKHEWKEDATANDCNSCAANRNVEPALRQLQPKTIALCGVVLGYCVKDAANYFLEKGYRVALITDAIKEFAADELAQYASWKDRGVLLLHTRDILNGTLEEKTP